MSTAPDVPIPTPARPQGRRPTTVLIGLLALLALLVGAISSGALVAGALVVPPPPAATAMAEPPGAAVVIETGAFAVEAPARRGRSVRLGAPVVAPPAGDAQPLGPVRLESRRARPSGIPSQLSGRGPAPPRAPPTWP